MIYSKLMPSNHIKVKGETNSHSSCLVALLDVETAGHLHLETTPLHSPYLVVVPQTTQYRCSEVHMEYRDTGKSIAGWAQKPEFIPGFDIIQLEGSHVCVNSCSETQFLHPLIQVNNPAFPV